MQLESDILIIGGGLAGLTAALHLNKLNFNVTLIEKHRYPHHKVCGEYVSNEVLPYLDWLGVSFQSLNPSVIKTLQFSSSTGTNLTTELPLGGFGLSRYAMDYYLYQQLLVRNVQVIYDNVTAVEFIDELFTVQTASGDTFTARQVLGAFGKRSSIDVKLNRNFVRKRSPYLAVKAHYRGKLLPNVVGLHCFDGGYCGVSEVEDGHVNICYLADYKSFEQHKNIASYQREVLSKNKYLREILEQSEMIFQAPLTIGQISFQPKEPVYKHMLMIGDSAGLIHPLCGNGMAMAMHGAQIAAELTAKFLIINAYSRKNYEVAYAQTWNRTFKVRLQTGRILAAVIGNSKLQHLAVSTFGKMPVLLRKMIKMTHGRPLTLPS